MCIRDRYTRAPDYPDGRDPKAVRKRQKSDFWDWLTTSKKDETVVKRILMQIEKQYRSLKKIAEGKPLTKVKKNELEDFRKLTCTAIGEATEAASFIIHGNQAIELFEGRLKELNVFGPAVDPYI